MLSYLPQSFYLTWETYHMDGSLQREATPPPRSIKWILGKRRQGCELWLNFPPRQVSGSSFHTSYYTYYMHVESKPSSEVCQVLLPSKGPQLVSVIGSSILECHFSPRFGHLLDSYKLGQLLPLVTPTNILYPNYTVIIHSYIYCTSLQFTHMFVQ